MKKQYTIAVCLIATRKYKIYVQPLLDSIMKYFLLRHKIQIHLFTDDISIPVYGDERVTIFKDLINAYGWPEATLYRYRIMTSKVYLCDYLFYFDVDYLIVDEIDEEILGDIVAVLHPGFSVKGGGSWCTNVASNAYTYPENRTFYFAGGTQGGRYDNYYKVMRRLNWEIEHDEMRGVRAEWNDESHWNRYVSEMRAFTILDSSYCMVEEPHLRAAWGIINIPPKIIALAKNHELIRS